MLHDGHGAVIHAVDRGMLSSTAQIPEDATLLCRVATEADRDRWNAFVHSHGRSTGYHLWEWRRVFAVGLGHQPHYLMAMEGERIRGVLPLCEVRSRLFGRALTSLPYVNYGGVLADSRKAGITLLEAAERIARDLRLAFVLLRHREQMFDHLPARRHKVSMVLPLPSGTDALWRDLDRKVRNQVRKAQKSNLTTHAGGHELVHEFYAVFAENMRDLGTPVYSQQLFSSICTTFPDSARVHLVRLGQRTIAGALSYAFKDTMEVPSASSLREFRPLCPNHLMYWSILSEAIERKHARFDFGRSTPNDGTYHFKEQWGALPESLCWEYALVSADRVPDEDRHNAKFRATIQAWKRLPLAVANRVGPWIARGIP